jgi:DNA-binding protein YbaB
MAGFGDGVQDRAREIQRIVTEARAEVFSDDYAVKVVVGPGGALLDVELTSRAAKYDGEQLGELIIEQIKRANQQLSADLSAQLDGLMGRGVEGQGRPGLSGLPSADEIRRIREENRREMETDL